MKKSEFELIANSLVEELRSCHNPYYLLRGYYPVLLSKYKNLLSLAIKELPEHEVFFKSEWAREDSTKINEALSTCGYILLLLALKMSIEKGVDEGKIFLGAEGKLKEAGTSFSNDDWPAVINNLNTCIELALKDKLDIPTTITKINTNKIIEICIADGVGPVQYLKEIKKHVLEIDNRVKHIAYSPSKKDCIDAIKATEDFLQKAKEHPFNVTAETRDKIYSGL